jgi:hypothetical protein
MPSIQVHGQGSGASSPVPGAKFGKINNNLTAMQEKAAADAMQSANPWASDRFKKANAGIERAKLKRRPRRRCPARCLGCHPS